MTTERTAGGFSRPAQGVGGCCFPNAGPLMRPSGSDCSTSWSRSQPTRSRVLSRVLAVEPGLVRTGLAVSLWVMLGRIVLGHVSRQLQANPHRFAVDRERRAFLARHTPGPGHYLKAIVASLLGSVIIWSVWEEFLVSFGRFVVVIVDPVRLSSLSIGSVAWIASFFVGFALFSHGIDRLLVGLVRTLIAVSLDGPDPDEPPA